MKPTLAITMGDINGVGPEILAKALGTQEVWELCHPVVVGDSAVLEGACSALGVAVSEETDGFRIDDAAHPAPKAYTVGQVEAATSKCAVEWTKHAVRLVQQGTAHAVVTCPISKAGLKLAGYPYTGHTEILMDLTQTEEIYMSLFSNHMRIVHASAHLPLARALAGLSADRIYRCVCEGSSVLERLGLPRRRIAVAGLNPHAGEDGLLGTEEATVIRPAVERALADGIDCMGPLPPDTVFRRMMLGEYDLVVAMYHDQGHIAFKMVAMDEGVQATLGIPIVRTSVDHGTAYDIAGKGTASEHSLVAAIQLAAALTTFGKTH